jgi:type IV secretory pathway VirB10-like protein
VPEKRFEELVVPADAVIGLQLENTISSDTARIEDRVSARVTRDVRTGGLVAIPAGSRVQGSVVAVERGGKFKERARLGVRFHTIVLADGTTVPFQSEAVYREGEGKGGQSAAKISGSAIGGAIIGAIIGGGKGAIIGGATGAGAGTAAVAAGDRSEARLAAGSSVTVRLSSPVSVTVEK